MTFERLATQWEWAVAGILSVGASACLLLLLALAARVPVPEARQAAGPGDRLWDRCAERVPALGPPLLERPQAEVTPASCRFVLAEPAPAGELGRIAPSGLCLTARHAPAGDRTMGPMPNRGGSLLLAGAVLLGWLVTMALLGFPSRMRGSAQHASHRPRWH